MAASKIRNLGKQIASRLNLFIRQRQWEDGIDEELEFWNEYLCTKGGEYPDDYAMRLDPLLPLQSDIESALGDMVPNGVLNALDVGAGPLTYLGKRSPRGEIAITAVDPLADSYDNLLARYGVTPLVRTTRGHAENLVELFGIDRFDLVHARNSIDHSSNPLLAIEQMVDVARPGGIVFMHHSMNEANKQGYGGFHQWNLSTHGGGELIVSNIRRRINISRRLASVATVTTQVFDRVWMINIIRKR